MKQTLSILLICTSLLLAACSQQPTASPQLPSQQPAAPTQPTTPTAPSQDQNPPPQLTPPTANNSSLPQVANEVSKSTNPLDSLPSDVSTVLEGAQTKAANGLVYTYLKTENGIPTSDKAVSAKVYAKGNSLKLELVSSTQNTANPVDEVILDTAKQTAAGYCVSKSLCGQTAPIQRNVSYSDYAFMQPLEWLSSLTSPQKLGDENIDNRASIKLSGKVNGDTVTIWADRFSGVPVRVDVGNVEYSYESMALGVTDSDLNP